jgi:uncharacterized membrane protein (UPF0127 family)
VVATRCAVANSFLTRGFGLIPRSALAEGEGLLITKTGSITMFFMRFAIDALFLDRSMRVLRVAPNLRPWVPAVGAPRGTDSVLELPAGTAARTGTQAGDELISSEVAAR